MAEEEVRAKLPNIYPIINRHSGEKNWEQIRDDFAALNWLDSSVQNLAPLVSSVFKLLDSYALSDLSEQPRCKLLRLNTVKIFLNTAFYNCSAFRGEMKDASTESKARISELDFFPKAKEKLAAQSPEQVADCFKRIAEIYEDVKDMAKCVTLHLKSTFQSDHSKDIEDYMDDQFFKKVIRDMRSVLREHESVDDTVRKYERLHGSTYGAHYGSSIGTSNYTSNYSSNWPNSYVKDNIYFGEVNEDGQRHGYGEITYSNGDVYKGEWAFDKPHGHGVYIWKDFGRYEGEFVAAKMQGMGKRVYQSGNLYVGAFTNGRKEGSGVMKFNSGDEYNGEWEDDYMNGLGTYSWAQGDSFTGRFLRDKREGKGTLTLASGEVIEGEWINGKMRPAQANP